MAESPVECKPSQMKLLNYISHNLGKKPDKEKVDDKERTECKNSSAKGTKDNRPSANSGPQPA